MVTIAALTGAIDDRLTALVIGLCLAAFGIGLAWSSLRSERRIDVFSDRIATHRLIGNATRQHAPFVAASPVATPTRVPRSSLEMTRWSIRLTDQSGRTVDIDPDSWWSAGPIDPTGSEMRDIAQRLRHSFASNAPTTPGTITLRTRSHREASVWTIRGTTGDPIDLLITAEPVAGRRVHPLPAADWLTGNTPARIVAVAADRTLVFIDLSNGSVGHVVTEHDVDVHATTSYTLHVVGQRAKAMKHVAAAMTPGWPSDVPKLAATNEIEQVVDLVRELAIGGDDRCWNLVVARALHTAHGHAVTDLGDHELGTDLAAMLQRVGERLGEAGFDATVSDRTAPPPPRGPIVVGDEVRVRLDDDRAPRGVVRGVAPWTWILVETHEGDLFIEVVLNRSAASWSRLFTVDSHLDAGDLEAVDRIARKLVHHVGDVDAVKGIGQALPATCAIERLGAPDNGR